MLEMKIVEHCAPTLAGLKAANLFNYKFTSIDTLLEELFVENRKLNRKGVFIEILKINPLRALLYVYRKNKLEADLKKAGVGELLARYGYADDRLESCIRCLKRRLSHNEDFPHEIGVFLSYPLEDVEGFIEQGGKNCICSGMWKVYCNECEAMKLFARFKKCTDVYRKLFMDGKPITQLTIAE